MLFIALKKNHVNMRNDNLLNVKHLNAAVVGIDGRKKKNFSLCQTENLLTKIMLQLFSKNLIREKVFGERLKMFIEN
jgi:hypothetical protein